jgi:CHASE2 domain-containing sensor protein
VNAAVRDLVVGGSESRAAAGLPDLHVLQKMLQALLVVGALAVVLVPRRKSALQLAALTAVLLIGFEIVLTHWSLLYITWFYPFAALALLAGSSLRAAPEVGDTGTQDLT